MGNTRCSYTTLIISDPEHSCSLMTLMTVRITKNEDSWRICSIDPRLNFFETCSLGAAASRLSVVPGMLEDRCRRTAASIYVSSCLYSATVLSGFYAPPSAAFATFFCAFPVENIYQNVHHEYKKWYFFLSLYQVCHLGNKRVLSPREQWHTIQIT